MMVVIISLLPLLSFFSLPGFLTAVLQNHSRKEGISVDELMFDFKIMIGPDDTEEVLSNTKEHINVKEVAFQVRGYHFLQISDLFFLFHLRQFQNDTEKYRYKEIKQY